MKKLIIPLLLAIYLLSTSASCKKTHTDSNGLPPATQEGKNTFGFLLNGQPWTPQGMRVTSNLSIDFDPNFKNGIFNIVAYNFIPSISEQFIISVGDSMNFVQSPKVFSLCRTCLYGMSFNKPCDYYTALPEVQSNGTLTITKLDRTNRIIAGIFNATLSKTACDTIRITEGRFDMKF